MAKAIIGGWDSEGTKIKVSICTFSHSDPFKSQHLKHQPQMGNSQISISLEFQTHSYVLNLSMRIPDQQHRLTYPR